jgi:hypothetical protein
MEASRYDGLAAAGSHVSTDMRQLQGALSAFRERGRTPEEHRQAKTEISRFTQGLEQELGNLKSGRNSQWADGVKQALERKFVAVSQQKQAEAQQEKELLRQQLDDLTVQVALATLIAPPPRIWLQTSLFVSQLREANEKRMHDSATIDHFTAQLTAESNARRLADSDLRVAKERVRPCFLPLRLVALAVSSVMRGAAAYDTSLRQRACTRTHTHIYA